VRIAGSLTDITERRHAAAAQEKAALLEEAMAAVGVGVALLDPKLTPCLPSPQLVAMTRSWPSVAAWFVDALELLGPVFPHQTRGGVLVDMGSPTGRRRVFSLSCTLRGAELMADATTPYVLLVRDKTASHLAAEQRLALTRELRAAHDDAVAANESKSEFIARLGLELRRAVGELTTAAGALDDTQETLAQTIRDEAGRVGATLARVAELNRVEAGSLPSEPVEVRAIDIIAPLIEEFEVRIAAVGSVFVHPKQADAVLVTDAGEVRRLLRELLDNALRSTPDGTVGLSIHPQGGTVDFVVRDTGAGIPEQLHEAVFEPFVRAGPDTHEGTGLGLSICRRTAERLGGGLQLRSATGSGTTVTLTLPCDAWTGRKKKAPQGP
jgi:signal transduction histidine kinase